MLLEFTFSDGMVRIKDVAVPNIASALDFSAPAGAFYSVLSDGGNPLSDTMTIWHEHGSIPIVSFIAGECQVPAGADFATLKPLIDAILSQSTPTPGTTMTPVGTIYVSGTHGSPTGNGSLADPINTITDGITLANTNSIADGLAWGVHVLTGLYDEQIVMPVSIAPIWITLGAGAEVIYSGISVTVDSTNANTHITMEQGSVLANSGGGAVLYPDVKDIVVLGNGTLQMSSPYPIIDMSASGSVTITGCTLLNIDPANTAEVINQAGGTLRLGDVSCISTVANTPIVKSGGTTILVDYRSYAPLAPNYAEAAAAQSIQITNCVANAPANVNITETVGAMLVDGSFTL